MIRIAINAKFADHNIRSGLQVYLENLLNELAAIDESNEYSLLFTSLRRKESQMPGPNKSNFHKKVLYYPDARFPYRDLIFNKVYLPRYLRKNLYNIFHAPAGYYLPDLKAIKKIITIHDLRSLKIQDKTFPQDIASLKKAARRADVCVAVSESTKKDVIELLDIKEDKIKVTYLGVDEVFHPIDKKESESIKIKYNLGEKFIFTLGYVPRKNIKRMIESFNKFKYKKEFLLVIGGVGESGFWASEYRELINKLNLGTRVRLAGYIPYNDLPLLYNACEFFIFPSLYEGFGIPILEAMSCGVPVITSNISSLPEIGKDAALYVDPYSTDDIAKQMERLTENKQLKETLIRKGTLRAQEFSWRKMAQETLKIYMNEV